MSQFVEMSANLIRELSPRSLIVLIYLSHLLWSDLFFARAQISPKEEFGEQAAIFIGSCWAQQYLKKRYCPSITEASYNTCIDQTLVLLPTDKLRDEFRIAITSLDEEVKSNGASGVDRGFRKVLDQTGGNRSQACLGFSTSLITFTYSKHEELKRIARRLR